jgi:hypothetical protein
VAFERKDYMTLLLSLLHKEAIIMAADSRLTTSLTPVDPITLEQTGPKRTEFHKADKLFGITGIGCITMWGDLTRVGQSIEQFLNSLSVSSIDDLADQLLYFLKKEVDEHSSEDVGFHVGGYRSNGTQALFHVFYGKDVGSDVDPMNNPQKFAKYDHSNFLALYNGKHEIAHTFINFLLALEKEVGMVRWITQHPIEKAIQFAGFIIKYASQIDQTIGDDIKIAVIRSDNSVEILTNVHQPSTNIKKVQEFPSPIPSGINLLDSQGAGTASQGYK